MALSRTYKLKTYSRMKKQGRCGYRAPEIAESEVRVEQGIAASESIYELNYSDTQGAAGDIEEVIDGGTF